MKYSWILLSISDLSDSDERRVRVGHGAPGRTIPVTNCSQFPGCEYGL